MTTLFEKPISMLVPSSVRLDYANVSNQIQVTYSGSERTKTVEVPTCLFKVMRYLGVPQSAKVSMYLEEYERKFVFGIQLDDEQGTFHDLWLYTRNQIPEGLLKGGS